MGDQPERPPVNRDPAALRQSGTADVRGVSGEADAGTEQSTFLTATNGDAASFITAHRAQATRQAHRQDAVLRLQRTYGNAFVQRVLQRREACQRCGGVPCGCSPQEKLEHASTSAAYSRSALATEHPSDVEEVAIQRLVAHELTHVDRQGGFEPPNVQRDARALQPSATARSHVQPHGIAQVVPQGSATSLTSLVAPGRVQRRRIQRQQEKPATCLSGKTEGTGFNVSRGSFVYAVWGTFTAGDTHWSFRMRALDKWLDWRFGKLPTDRRGRVMDYLASAEWEIFVAEPQPGCNYAHGFSLEAYRNIRILAGEAPQAAPPSQPDAPLQNVLSGDRRGAADQLPPSADGKKKAERGAPIHAKWSVLDGNEPLARQYLLEMQHFAGMPK